MTQKFIIHCDPENVLLAARICGNGAVVSMAIDVIGLTEFQNGVMFEYYKTPAGTIIVRQYACEGG